MFATEGVLPYLSLAFTSVKRPFQSKAYIHRQDFVLLPTDVINYSDFSPIHKAGYRKQTTWDNRNLLNLAAWLAREWS